MKKPNYKYNEARLELMFLIVFTILSGFVFGLNLIIDKLGLFISFIVTYLAVWFYSSKITKRIEKLFKIKHKSWKKKLSING